MSVMTYTYCLIIAFAPPIGIKAIRYRDNLTVCFHEVYGNLFQAVECTHGYLLSEVLSQRPYKSVIIHYQCAVMGIKRRQLVNLR